MKYAFFLLCNLLLHDDMGVYAEDRAGQAVHNWQYVDKLYNYLQLTALRNISYYHSIEHGRTRYYGGNFYMSCRSLGLAAY